MISRRISGEEQQAGAPDGLILIPTMSPGLINFAQAACADFSCVSSFIAYSSICRTIGCETRLRAMALGFRTSITRPGNNHCMSKGEPLEYGRPGSEVGG